MNRLEISHVNDSIAAVLSKFKRAPNIFLTEEDLRTHLCCELLKHFGNEQLTNDNDRSISLHTEVRWYGDGSLKIRSDIVLVNVSNLKVLRYAKMPSKGFEFNIPKGIIELKFRRPNGESGPVFKRKIRGDMRKLKKLKDIFYNISGHGQTCFWLVVLDKKAKLSEPIFEPEDGINVTYEFSNKGEQDHVAGNTQ